MSECKIYCELVRLAKLNGEYIEKLEKQNVKYKEALEKYASYDYWKYSGSDVMDAEGYLSCAWELARETLGMNDEMKGI